ncbi:MAG TPA: family 1 glycosylhydrolase [Bacillota bacterium]|jgi:beta-glucosidase
MATVTFPPGFYWGTATSSHQIEGHNTNNDWWDWEQQPGNIKNGDRSGAADDAWNRYVADFDQLKELNQNAYRFSVEWSRVEPTEGQFDRAALDRYLDMIRQLRKRGIEPFLTLHHFTNPKWIAARGSWENEQTPAAFEGYVKAVVEHLGTEAPRHWITLNEPMVLITMGYVLGVWLPKRRDFGQAGRVFLNLLEAHKRAYKVIKAAHPEARVGLAHSMSPFQAYPGIDPETGAERGSWLNRTAARLVSATFNWPFLEALRTGREYILAFGVNRRDPELVGTQDFIGLNYYTRGIIRFNPLRPIVTLAPQPPAPGVETTTMRNEVYPQGIHQCLTELWKRFKPMPIFITENGVAVVEDEQRSRYILSHLAQARRAMDAGVDVRGFFYWSSTDNFEWSEGYTQRFGLIHVDFATQARTVRPSGRLYGQIAKENKLPG